MMGLNVGFFSIILFIFLYFVIISKAEETPESTSQLSTNQTVEETLLSISKKTEAHSRWFPKIFARLHGLVLVISWLGLTPIAILIARYYKRDINCDQLGFRQTWFQIHQTLMYINLVLNILGAIFIYMRIGGWSGVSFH